MEQALMSGLENFGAVWRRVRGEDAPRPEPEVDAAAALGGHMDALAASAAYLTTLAGRCGAGSRGELLRLAAASARRFRCLQLEYFLLTGGCYRPAGSCPCRADPAQGLRTAYLAAGETEKALRADAEKRGGALRETLLDAAEGEARSARALRELLKRRIVGEIR